MTANPLRTSVLLGVPIDDVTLDEAVDHIAAMVEVGRSNGRVHQVVTVNGDFVVNAIADPMLLDIMQRTDLAVPDGMAVVWASRLTGAPLRARTTGIDLLPAIVTRAAKDCRRVVLFGGARGVAERAAEFLCRSIESPDTVVAVNAPRVGADGSMDADSLRPIREVQPDIVCVALGNPKQEHWIARHGRDVGAPVLIGIGGSLDFLTGVTKRAPQWMQRSGLEWVHRAASQPRRLVGRYARDIRVFVPAVIQQAWRGRRRGHAVLPTIDIGQDVTTVIVSGSLPSGWPEPVIIDRLRRGQAVNVELRDVGPLDNPTVSALAGLARTARRLGGDVRFGREQAAMATPWRGSLGRLLESEALAP